MQRKAIMSGWWITVQVLSTVVIASAMVMIILRLNLCLQSRRTRAALRRKKVRLIIATKLDSGLAPEAPPDSGKSTGRRRAVLKPVAGTKHEPGSVSQLPSTAIKTGNAPVRSRNDSVEREEVRRAPDRSEDMSARTRPTPAKPDEDYYNVSADPTSRQIVDTVLNSELVEEGAVEPGFSVDEMIQVEAR